MTKLYCTQNEGDCDTCSLVSYGRDCANIPLNLSRLKAAADAAEEFADD